MKYRFWSLHQRCSVHPSTGTQHSNDKNSNQATRNESSTSQISGKLNHESTHLNVVDERTNPDSNNKILPRARAPATRTSPTTRVARTQRTTATLAASAASRTLAARVAMTKSSLSQLQQ
ncbi:hypothetical protein PC116_g14594 [Phytophthora cactorum]|nr:hypothetical protein PC117_g10222 [Phytophthora cactorum]KAG4237343.1 hypothetical protein PC116_g14594 [Phytophthora cactorum]